MTYAKKVLAPSGRWAIMVRKSKQSQWVQVESIKGEDNANRMLDDLENDIETRCGYIINADDEEWGADAPSEGDMTDGR